MTLTAQQSSAAAEEAPFDVEGVMRVVQHAVRHACGPTVRPHAEDIAQAVITKLLQRARTEPERFPRTRSYLWKMANHAVIDELRRIRRRGEQPLDATSQESGAPRMDEDPERAAQGQEVGSAIHGCLAALPEPRRLAVTLHLQGHPLREAASILGWTKKRVDNLTYRGLAALRECLRRKGVAPA